jgi:UPF0755 protein
METKTNTQPRNIIFKVALSLLVLLLLIAGFSYYKINKMLGPVDINDDSLIPVEIQNNMGTGKIAQLLYENGLINNSTLFRIYVKNEGLDRFLKAGKYELSPSMSTKEIVDILLKGQLNLISFTIPEGFTIEQIANSLQKQGLADSEKFLKLTSNGDFDFPWINELPEGKLRLEGFLFPDTYKIPENFSEEEIIQMMLNRFVEIFNEDYQARMNELGMNILEVITLASIIEREIKVPEERAIASAVFHNRLNKNMMLQSCATVQYALGEIKEELSNKDLEIDSPYNTYKISGLPPGPIAAPGEEAIKAALFPSDDDYLYFVLKPDGSHHFSRTLAEHNRAIDLYLR